MLSNNKIIVGASGNLGRHIVHQALKRPNLLVNILVRSKEKAKDLVDEVISSGGKVFEGDVTQPDTIRNISVNIHTIISALVGNDDVVIQGQKNLLEDAERHGVKRFVPSDFSGDIWSIPLGQHYFTDQRLKFRQILDKSKIMGLHFSNGYFLETYFYWVNKLGFTYWGDINSKIDLTPEEDVAKFVIAAVSDKDRVGHIRVVSIELSTKEILDTYNLVLGKQEQAKKLGSLDELRNKVQELQKSGNFKESVELGYTLMFFDGSVKIKNKMNSEFPDVKVMKLDEFLKNTQGKMTHYHFTISDVLEEQQKQKPLKT